MEGQEERRREGEAERREREEKRGRRGGRREAGGREGMRGGPCWLCTHHVNAQKLDQCGVAEGGRTGLIGCARSTGS